MKYPHVSSPVFYLVFTLSIICCSLSATAAIVRTDMVFYDLATASQRSYTLSIMPTPDGAHVMVRRDDNKSSLSTDFATCFNTQVTAEPEGYLRVKKREAKHADPGFAPFLNFTQDNHLRVAMKPLANAQSLLLDKDTLTVFVVDPTIMTLNTAGCQR